MKQTTKRIWAILLVVGLICPMLNQSALAYNHLSSEQLKSGSMVNPVYADVADVTVKKAPSARTNGAGFTPKTSDISHTLEEAAQKLRQGMIAREASISVTFPADAAFDFDAIFTAAMEHTGVPAEGDYLQYHWTGLSWDIKYGSVAGMDCFTIFYYPEYLTTAKQEAEVDAEVEKLLKELNLYEASDYDKVKGIYDWLCQNVTYDNDNLNNNSYTLKHSAYAALINKTAVCQGYATLFYRLALELNVDCRFIFGTGNGGDHAWNIVKLDGLYYNLDATWDAAWYEAGLPYSYFLRGSLAFEDHSRSDDYNNPDFNTAYPTSPTDYGIQLNWPVTGVCGDNLTWSLNEEGVLTISGSGDMYDFYSDYPDWNDYAWNIKSVVVEDKVTTIGAYAFYFCTALQSLTVKGSATIGEAAFIYCSDLKTISIPKVTSIADFAFGDCVSLQEVHIPSCTEYIGYQVFAACSSLSKITVDAANDSYRAENNVLFTKDGTRLLAAAVALGTSYTVPETVKQIDPYAFSYNTTLESVTISGKVQMLSDHVFAQCTGLKQVTLPEGMKLIGESAFENCASLTTVTLPESLQTIALKAFSGCTALKELELPKYVSSIEECAFDGCENLQTITFTGNAPAIGDNAFQFVFARVYYPDPACNTSWKAELLLDYGGFLQWNSYDVHNYTITVTLPTCEQDGFTTYTCSGCGHSYTDNYVTSGGHIWDNGTVLVEPGENTPGERLYICTVCEGTKTEVIPPKDHTHEYTSNVVAPTCEEQGYTEHTCACGESFQDSFVPAPGHSFGQWYETKQPTCTQDGTQQRDCANCTDYEVAQLPATGHSYTPTVVPPTCLDRGYTSYDCHCGDSYLDDYTEATGHSFTTYVTDGNATCTEDGTKTAVCDHECGAVDTVVDTGSAKGHTYSQTVTAPSCAEQGFTTHICPCGHSYVDSYVDALGHDWDEGTVEAEPTDQAEGRRKHTCKRCGETKTEPIPMLPHDHSYTDKVVPPTCEEQGYTEHTCRCGETYQDTFVEATGHAMSDWTQTKAPTCTEAGEERSSCANCDHSDVKQIDPLGHQMGEWTVIKPATEQEEGLKRRQCAVCEHVEEEVIPIVTGPSQITSEAVTVGENTISKITAGMTANDLLAQIPERDYIKIYRDDKEVGADAKVATGMEVRLIVGDNVVQSLTIIVTGDINGDGNISVTDFLMLKSHLLKKSTLEGVYASAADTNGDGNITVTDFLQVKAHLLRKNDITPRSGV